MPPTPGEPGPRGAASAHAAEPPTFEGYAFSLRRHAWRGREMSYVDVGDPSSRALVLLHGNPTWSYLWRKVIGPLSKRFRVLAPDLIGFGLSTPASEGGALGFEEHVASVADLLRGLRLRAPILVGQDWGGPILGTIAAQGEIEPGGLVLMNTYLPGAKLSFGLYTLLFQRPWSPLLVVQLDGLRRYAFRFGFRRRPSRAVLRAYRHPHATAHDRAAVLALARSLPGRGDQLASSILARLDSYLLENPCPKLLLFSDGDPIFPQEPARRLAAALPRARFVPIEDAGHFLQEDAGDQIASLLAAWAAGLS